MTPDAAMVPPNTILDVLRAHAAERPGHPALIFDDGNGPTARLSYGELAEAVRGLAGTLAAQGLGNRPVGLLFGPGIDFIVTFLACLTIGSIAVPLAPVGRRRERVPNLLPVVRDCMPAAMILDAGMAVQYGGLAEALAKMDVAYLEHEALAPAPPSTILPSPPGSDDVAVLQYTSGSTSAPKGVMITHGNIIANQRMIRRTFGHDDRSNFVGWAPHFHDQGLFGNILQPLYLGATCVLTAPATFVRRPLVWLELIDRYRAHTSGGPNFAFELCIEHATLRGLPAVNLSCWKVAFNGAEPIRARSVERFAESFAPVGFAPEAFFPCYGLAESTVVTACGPRDKGPVLRRVDVQTLGDGHVLPADPRKPVLAEICCGPAMEESELWVVDPERHVVAAPGDVGEIWVAGPHIGRGYWNRTEESRATFGALMLDGRGPYLRTGDVGFMMPEGLYVVGRIKDLLIVRGRNFAPNDIEQIWTDVTGHAGQATAAAFQVAHGETSHVVLVAEIERGLRTAEGLDGLIADYGAQVRRMGLDRLDLAITDLIVVSPGGIPRTTSGKVRRAATRTMLEKDELPVIGTSGPLMARRTEEA
ncbi:fatty acyl-AMP ligase [Sphingobium sufflavum]|uniref:fatty acyl-AMP ligase n=1 Tax=Sphingobium sufflavum TaxID=1129547 RepID=UPI001F2FA3A7|nr:fatty acyl-AMP ligase [Sphingobium sufflavum]MCE7797104.1 fatty acyl-AMP ligase [Sphingobium sufflavum]